MLELLALTALITGILFGITQSQVMVKPCDRMHQLIDLGVRGHVWFRYYHAIYGAGLFFFAVLIWLLSHVHSWEPFVLVFAVGWLAFEPSYQYGRYRTFMDRNYPEHVVFFDIIDFHAAKVTMTIIRLILVGIIRYIIQAYM